MAAPRIVVAGVAMIFAFTALFVTAFHAPRPRNVDIGVAGSPAQVRQVQEALGHAAPGAFAVHGYAGEAQARAALLDTDVDGVLVLAPGRPRILVAEALGAVPTDTVTTALGDVAARAGMHPAVQDLRPLPASDGRGLAPFFTVVGTLMPSLAFGILLWALGRRLSARVRMGALLAYAIGAGLVAAFNVDVLVGAFDGRFLDVAAVVALLALALAAAAHGLGRLFGPPGIAVGLLVLLLVGLSSSGGAVTFRFEPGFYGAVSQLLPPGAGLTALRDAAYFDWSGTLTPLLVLGAWAAGGLACGVAPVRSPVRGWRARRMLPA